MASIHSVLVQSRWHKLYDLHSFSSDPELVDNISCIISAVIQFDPKKITIFAHWVVINGDFTSHMTFTF